MELTITLAIAIIGCIISVSTFVLNRKDKSNKDGSENSYRQGQLDMQIKQILQKLDKIEKHIEIYDKEIQDKIDIALKHHIKEWHKGE